MQWWIVNSTYNREPHLMHLVRLQTLLCSLPWFKAKHILGIRNGMICPAMMAVSRQPSPVPPALVSLVPWTSTIWISQFKHFEASLHLKFCQQFTFCPLPVSENIMCYFVVCLGQEGPVVLNNKIISVWCSATINCTGSS